MLNAVSKPATPAVSRIRKIGGRWGRVEVEGVCAVQFGTWLRTDREAMQLAVGIARDPAGYLAVVRLLNVPGIIDLRQRPKKKRPTTGGPAEPWSRSTAA